MIMLFKLDVIMKVLYVMTLIVIFSVLSSVHRLERSYSDSKSFMTCRDCQIGHLVIRLVIV